jgi:hypothetical protein
VADRYQTSQHLLADLKSLKEKLEFEAKFEAAATSGARPTIGTANGRAFRTDDFHTTPTTSSVEYFVDEIRRHKKAVIAIASMVVLVTAVSY